MKRTTLVAAVALLATVATASVLAARGGWHEGRGGQHGWGHHNGAMQGPMGNIGFGDRKGSMRGLRNIAAADADKNGAVTLDEYLKDKTDDFTKADANNDGALDGVELVGGIVAGHNYRMKAMIKQLDTNLDGKVTKDDFATRAREQFAARDINGDGVIDRGDMGPGRRGKWGRGDDRRGADEGNDDTYSDEATDRDDDDDDRDEGRRGRRGGWGKSAKLEKFVERAERTFDDFDDNNDGEINAADFDKRHAEMIDFAQKKALASLDKDRDGKVTKDEFLAGPKDQFARLDLDGDATITAADLPPRMAERWSKGKGETR